MNEVADDVTIACWAAVGVLWLVGAIVGHRRSQSVFERTGRDLATWVIAVLGGLVIRLLSPDWHSLTAGGAWLRILGIVVIVPAAAATAWARVTLGTMWSAGVVRREHHQLRTDGPYAITRHPIYTGLLSMIAGTALTQGGGGWILVLAIVAALLAIKLRAEERLMTREFPVEYERYRERVPALVPRLTRLPR